MERRTLGKTGLDVSVLGFGAAEIGYENADQKSVDRIIGAAVDGGVNFIDTGECYPGSEERIGIALTSKREEVYLFTKCGHASGLPGDDWSPDVIHRSIERSLRRLRTDRLDLAQLHSCSAEVIRRGDAIRVLQDAKYAGKTRFVGYSGDSTDAAAALDTGIFDVLETSINLADQEAITLTIPKAVEQSMGVLVKRPLANVAWKYEEFPANPYPQEYWRRLKHMDYLFLHAGSFNASLATALRFALSVQGVAAAIVGSKSEEHFRQNLTLVPPTRLPTEQFDCIRRIWNERALPSWVGQV
jgi:aryl-alcohol dehydrogenase-like predicted oxidoreductase